jgi:DNA processing protein
MPLEWIALNSIAGLGPVKIQKLVERYGSASEVFRRPVSELVRTGLVPEMCVPELTDKNLLVQAEEQRALAEKECVAVITLGSPQYPPYLKEIFGPPPVIFVRGDLSVFSLHAVAVVGTRHPTPYGKTVTPALTRGLVERGLVIVSGLAMGIDTIAHLSCLECNGRTVAVLGCGIDQILSNANRQLARRIGDSGGAVVSEFPMGTPAEPFRFPRRNRIISGLSAGVLVVEGGEKSGSLITAHYALQQGRDVFAVPGPISSPLSTGPFNLIRDGAIPARSGHEIAEALSLIEHPNLRAAAASGQVMSAPLSLMSETERAVYNALSDAPRRIDEIAESCGRRVAELFDLLLNLELKGLARQMSGGRYVRP